MNLDTLFNIIFESYGKIKVFRGGNIKTNSSMTYFTSNIEYAKQVYSKGEDVIEREIDNNKIVDLTMLGTKSITLSFIIHKLRENGINISSSDFRQEGDYPIWAHLQMVDKTNLLKLLEDKGFYGIKWIEWGPPYGEYGANMKAEAYLLPSK